MIAWLKKKLKDRWWRLNNLYYIVDADGNKVKFQPNKAQKRLLKNMHWRNIILKARQLGFTTFVCIFALDLILFNSNMKAGIVAHRDKAAEEIFRDKIKYAYNNLPETIKELRPTIKDDAKTLIVKHADNSQSSIVVSTSLRSGTYQLIHISEHGKICAETPKRAKEIKTGTLPAAHAKAFVFIESTAEGGKHGDFWGFTKEAMEMAGEELSNIDFKFHFFPWFLDDKNRTFAGSYCFTDEQMQYFAEIEKYWEDNWESVLDGPVKFKNSQKLWYVKNKKKLGDLMLQEHPSTPEEAFTKPVEGAYYAKLIGRARTEGRIKNVPYDPSLPVYTFWDLGMNDPTTIWFAQFLKGEIRLIDYYENSEQGLEHYISIVKNKPYIYASHFAPHDIKVKMMTGFTRWELARNLGVKFEVLPAASVDDGIQAVKSILPICWFDKGKCARGLTCLENYRSEYNERLEKYEDKPLHNWASHGADAKRYLAMAYRYKKIDGKIHNPKIQAAVQRREKEYDPLRDGLR